VFEKYQTNKAARKKQAALDRWKTQRDSHVELLQLVRSFKGSASEDIMLSAGEAIFYKVTGAALIEERRGKGHYVGRSSGFSIPLGSVAGRSVRYRVGATRRRYVQGRPTSTAVDTGSVYITNKRVIFQGSKQTRECAFGKLIGFQHSGRNGSTTFSVSNRQKPTTIRYGSKHSDTFDFRLDLALAHFRGTLADLVRQLQTELAQLDAERPPRLPG
jgi:hypothetical protein